MGNNKGRSKGCVTCLRRRVKCDLTRPICTRCSKGRFACEGYRETLFIDARDQVLRRLGRDCKPPHTSHLMPSLSNSAMRDDQFLSYLVANLDGPMRVICGSLTAPSHQTGSLQQTATKQCFLALATTFYGLGHAQESLLRDGLQLYVRALKLVNTAIRDSTGTRTAHEAISSVALLALHEVIAPTRKDKHSWLHHIDGLEQLFATYANNDPVTLALLEISRPMMIVSALYARRPSLMARPEWSATVCVPSDDDQNPSTIAVAYLWDSLAQIPELYHAKDAVQAFTDLTPSAGLATDDASSLHLLTKVQELLDRSLRIRDDISFQMMRWKAADPHSEFPTVPRALSLSKHPYPYAVVTHFSSMQAANTSTLYNAVVILINQYIISVCPLLTESATEQISIATADILKSIDYHLSFTEISANRTLGSSGPRNVYLLFSLRVAYRVLSQSEGAQDIAKKLWLEDILRIINDRAGPWMSNRQIFSV